MKKIDISLVKKYANGEDLGEFTSDQLENDKDFMMGVISYTNDIKIYSLCSESIKKDYEFVKYLVLKFKDNPETRMKIRHELKLEDKFVIGHVGRFSYQKNHIFLLDILKKVFDEKSNAVAILIWEGELEEKIKAYANKLNIIDKIIFLKSIPNVNDYMQSFDIFVLPSKFEGLPIVGIEGQFANLPCLFSDKISSDVIIGENSRLLPIENAKLWADEILSFDIRNNKLIEEKAQKYKKEKMKEYAKFII